MTRRRNMRLVQIVAYVLSAIVALTLILSLVGPVLIREPRRPTPTWTPTWTPFPAFTKTPTPTRPMPTATQTPTVTPTVALTEPGK